MRLEIFFLWAKIIKIKKINKINDIFVVVAANEIKGTAYKSRLDEIKFSGKTGTSQVKTISIEERESEDFRKKELEWKNRDHALFVAFAPYKEPRYSISVVIEHGGSGSKSAAPIAKQVIKKVLEKHSLRESSRGLGGTA